MLIILPSTPTTQKASEYLQTLGVLHSVIEVPLDIGYKTASDLALYTKDTRHGDVAMLLTKARFVVMRVFRSWSPSTD